MNTFEQFLEILGTDGSGVPDVNAGGCGHFAEYCCTFLRSIGVNAEVVVFDSGYDVKVAIDNNTIAENGCAHVMVFLPDFLLYIDGEGVFDDPGRWNRYGEPKAVPLELLVQWNAEDLRRVEEDGDLHPLWNWMWDRSNIDHIVRFFDQFKLQAA